MIIPSPIYRQLLVLVSARLESLLLSWTSSSGASGLTAVLSSMQQQQQGAIRWPHILR